MGGPADLFTVRPRPSDGGPCPVAHCFRILPVPNPPGATGGCWLFQRVLETCWWCAELCAKGTRRPAEGQIQHTHGTAKRFRSHASFWWGKWWDGEQKPPKTHFQLIAYGTSPVLAASAVGSLASSRVRRALFPSYPRVFQPPDKQSSPRRTCTSATAPLWTGWLEATRPRGYHRSTVGNKKRDMYSLLITIIYVWLFDST